MISTFNFQGLTLKWTTLKWTGLTLKWTRSDPEVDYFEGRPFRGTLLEIETRMLSYLVTCGAVLPFMG